MVERIQTEDLVLKAADTDFAQNVAAYYLRNREFLEAFEPKRDEEFYTADYQHSLLKKEMEQAGNKEAFRFYIETKQEPGSIIGMIALNNIVWGCFHSCFLGYKLDVRQLNRGYMTQAVSAVTQVAFEDLRLHRIEANVMPRNGRSLRVLEKCGFENEGSSKQYLKINGVWEDHIHMVKLNTADL